jgi:hypothetical protein
MLSNEIILGTGEVDADLSWVPGHISKFMGEIAVIDNGTVMVAPEKIVRQDKTTLFACSGVQIIYPQLFDGVPVPDLPQLISQPVIRTQHLKGVEEGRSTSFVNYNLIGFGLTEEEHQKRTKEFFDRMKDADVSGVNHFRHVLEVDVPQTWNGLPVMMNTNEKLWINGVELGESIFYAEMPLPSGEKVSVSELAFGFERLVFATDPGSSYYPSQLGGVDTDPVIKSNSQAAVCDAIKSCVLMAMNEVSPSNNNQGYQMRRFIKNAVAHHPETDIDTDTATTNAYRYWTSFIKPVVEFERVSEVITTELDRSYNRRTLDFLSESEGIIIDININQSRSDFERQLIGTGRIGSILITNLFQT